MGRHPTSLCFENESLDLVEQAMECTSNKRSYRRLHTIRLFYLGYESSEIKDINNLSERLLNLWVSRFNEKGIDGLITRPKSGRPKKITVEKEKVYGEYLENPSKADEDVWTARKFHGFLKEEFSEEVSYSTVVRFFHEQKMSLQVPRRFPLEPDDEKREAFRALIKELLTDEDVEIWFGDEMGVEGDPRPRRQWAKVGSRPTQGYTGKHIRLTTIGMVCPRTGEFFGVEMPFANIEAFQAFLLEAAICIDTSKRKRHIIVLDNASWHKSKKIDWGPFEPLFLPAYSPDLNPIERLWLIIKARFFTSFIAKDHDSLSDKLCEALCYFINSPQENASICKIAV